MSLLIHLLTYCLYNALYSRVDLTTFHIGACVRACVYVCVSVNESFVSCRTITSAILYRFSLDFACGWGM